MRTDREPQSFQQSRRLFLTLMTIDGDEDDVFRESLNVSRNKVEMLLRFALDSVVDAFIKGNDPVLPIPTRGGSLEFSKSPEKFG